MQISFINHCHPKYNDLVTKLERLCNEVNLVLQKDSGNLIEIELVKKNVIKKLNNRFRKIDTPTDILSFPQAKYPDLDYTIFGSLVICPGVVRDKNEELDDVVKHGLLHLYGFDHETNEKDWDCAAALVSCNL